MVNYKLFVEGGGNSKALRSDCKQGFTKFLQKIGLQQMPRVMPCGSRKDAYDDFCIALNAGERAFLLVDSEEPVHKAHAEKPWKHLATSQQDQWQQPSTASDKQCHLMVVCMESWFLADRADKDKSVLAIFFGQDFQINALPAFTRALESITKQEIDDALAKATAKCKTKPPYDKGRHSFKLLAELDAERIGKASPWAGRFLEQLKKQR